MNRIKKYIIDSYRDNPAKWYSGIIIYLLYVLVLYLEEGLSVALGLPLLMLVIILSSSMIYYIVILLFDKQYDLKVTSILLLIWLIYFPIIIYFNKTDLVLYTLVFSSIFGIGLALIEKIIDG